MNVQTSIRQPTKVRLTVDDFVRLRQSDAFAGFSKAELIDGHLYGVLTQSEDEPESDASLPIKLRVEDYLLLERAGAFASYGKTELVDGAVYQMSPQHRPHGFVKDELAYRLRRQLESLDSELHVATEQSVALPAHSEPQPDIILTSEPRGTGAIPGRSVTLVVEVSAHTLRFDLDDKMRTYATGGIAEYWVADINDRVIHQMWTPDGERYVQRQTIAFGNSIAAATLDGLTIDTAGL